MNNSNRAKRFHEGWRIVEQWPWVAPLLIIGLTVFLFAACGTQSVTDERDERNRTANVQASPESHGATSAPMAHDSTHGGHAMMDHSQMHSSPGAEKAPYDLQFIDTMVAHHQGAVDMARLASERAEHKELKELASKIIEAQEREIAQMRTWRERWYKGQAPAVNMDLPGMRESMMMDMQKLSAARGREFDLLFIDMMIPHHEGAVVMSRQALERAEHAELKKLAEQIIAAQQAEIAQMRKWRTEWGK